MFNKVQQQRVVNGYTLSLVGGEGIYSSPRICLDSLDQYESVEVALFDADDNWVNPRKLGWFPADLAELWEPGDGDCVVAGWVSHEDVARVVEALRAGPRG